MSAGIPLQLRTGGFCWSRALLLACPCYVVRILENLTGSGSSSSSQSHSWQGPSRRSVAMTAANEFQVCCFRGVPGVS